MTRVLVLAEARRGAVRQVTAEAVSAGLELKRASGAELVVAIVADDPSRYEAGLSFDGVDEIIGVATGTEHVRAPRRRGGARAADRGARAGGRRHRPERRCAGVRGRGRGPRRARVRERRAPRRVGGRLRDRRSAARTAAGSSPSSSSRAGRRRSCSPGSGRSGPRRCRRMCRRPCVASIRTCRHPAASTSALSSRQRRGRHHEGGLPALDRSWRSRRRAGGDAGAARRAPRRDPDRLSSGDRRRLGSALARRRPVREDGDTQGLSRARHLRRRPAPRWYPRCGDRDRGQHGPAGTDLRGRRLRRGLRPGGGRGRAAESSRARGSRTVSGPADRA